MRQYLVEVSITQPRGQSIDDWNFIAKIYEDVNEGSINTDALSIAGQISEAIHEWQVEKSLNKAIKEASNDVAISPIDA